MSNILRPREVIHWNREFLLEGKHIPLKDVYLATLGHAVAHGIFLVSAWTLV